MEVTALSVLIAGALFASAFIGSLSQSPDWAFRWIYLPAIALVPRQMEIVIIGLPEISGRRAALLGLVLGAIMAGTSGRLLPRWRLFDLLPVMAAMCFAVSFGVQTTFRGVYTEMLSLTLDWIAPYVLSRAFLRDARSISRGLLPLALASSVLAAQAAVEWVSSLRFIWYWNMLGADLGGRPAWVRWGLTRAIVHFSTPVSLGAYFATLTPLMAARVFIERERSGLARLTMMACALGCVAAMSRGPWLSLMVATAAFTLVAIRARIVPAMGLVALLALLPWLVGEFQEAVRFTLQGLAEKGNVDSGHYRIALYLIYWDDIAQAGWFGDAGIIGSEYAKASSIDNAYLGAFIRSGWLGGSALLVMAVFPLIVGTRAALAASGQKRKFLSALTASHCACALSMLNTWFNPCYSVMLWVTAALTMSQARAARHAVRSGRARRGRANPRVATT